MSERLRSSSSRSSLSIEAPNRSLQTLPFRTVSNVWSLSPAAGWGVEHRDLCSSEAQCSCQTGAQTSCEWLNNHRQLQRRFTRNFVSCYTSKFTPQGSSSWGDSAEALRLGVFLTNEWNVPLTPSVPISTHVTAISRIFIMNMLWLEISVGLAFFYGIWQLMYFADIERHCSLLLLYRLIKISYSQLFITILVC